MPFCKRTVLPKDVCKPDGRRLRQAEIFGDLADVCGFTLCSVLRQLSDLSRHSVSILEELEGELVSVCHRSGALEGRVVRLQRHVAELVSKPPPRSKRKLKTSSVDNNTPGVTLHSWWLQEESSSSFVVRWSEVSGVKLQDICLNSCFPGEMCGFAWLRAVSGHHPHCARSILGFI